jgi:hypothetical protein
MSNYEKRIKVKSLCLTKHHNMKMYWGMEVWLHAFLTLALDGDEWSAALATGKEPLVPPGQEVGCAPEPVWTRR